MLYMEGIDDGYENDYGLLVVGQKIEILWKYTKMYFSCNIISYNVTPSPAVPAIPPMEATTISASIIDYIKKAWSPLRL